MKFEIKHRHTLSVLFSTEAETLKEAVEEAVRKGTNLGGADLRGANLGAANLGGAGLGGANLGGANLYGAKIRDDITVSKAPLQLLGLTYPVIIWDHHMQIGCEFHSHDEWAAFDDAAIAAMDGRAARKFWDAHKAMLLALCKSHAPADAAEEGV